MRNSVLDGVGDLQMIADHRETLQGRAKADTGGVSPTMVYAYGFTLCKRAVVVTMDEAAENLGLLESHHWLADRRNVLPFRLSEPAFVQPLGLWRRRLLRSLHLRRCVRRVIGR